MAVSKDAEGLRIPLDAGIAGSVATGAEPHVNIPAAYADARFNQAIDKKTGFTTKHILCMPFKDRQGRIVAVVQAVNKMRMGRATNRPFDSFDERRLFQFCAEIAQILSVNALDMFYGQATAEGKADFLEIFSDRNVRLNRRRQSLLVTTLMMSRGRSPVSRRKTAVLMQINTWDFSSLSHEQDHLEVCFLHIMDESGAIARRLLCAAFHGVLCMVLIVAHCSAIPQDNFKIEAGKLKVRSARICLPSDNVRI